MSYYSSVDYTTTNKSNQDITKDFDVKQFNIKFEINDEELKSKLTDEFKIKVNDIPDTCQDDYNNKYFKYGMIFILAGLGLLFIFIIINSYNKPKKI